MKIGLTFGGYAPLHQGHLDIIYKAKKQNDLSFVAVCGFKDDIRTKEIGITFEEKYSLIKQYLEDETLVIFPMDDRVIDIDGSMSDSNWIKWLDYFFNYVFDLLDNSFPFNDVEFTMYYAEDIYTRHLKEYIKSHNIHCELSLENRINPISGTKCRNSALKNWNKIVTPYRKYFSHNILITGTASEGKTTLVNDISSYFGLVHSYEKGRDNYKSKKDQEFDYHDFLYNLVEQNKLNSEQIASSSNTGIFISDTDNIVTLMYAYFYAQRDGFSLTGNDYKKLYEKAYKERPIYKWSKIFVLSPHKKPIVDDGERYMGDSDYSIRYKFFEKLISLYKEFGYEYEILVGSYYDNFTKVKEYIEKLYE